MVEENTVPESGLLSLNLAKSGVACNSELIHDMDRLFFDCTGKLIVDIRNGHFIIMHPWKTSQPS